MSPLNAVSALSAAVSRLAIDVPVAGPKGPVPPGPDPRFGASLADKIAGLVTRFEQAGLNPQPLPPKAAEAGAVLARGTHSLIDDWCGTVPKKFPFPPPPPPPFGDVIGPSMHKGM